MSQQPIQVAEAGAGFQYSPFGMLPIGTSIAPTEEYSGAAVPRAPLPSPALTTARVPLPAETQSLAEPRGAASAGSPGAVLKAARARVTAIRKELRRHAALKRELDELERLLAAAKKKPEAQVRALRVG